MRWLRKLLSVPLALLLMPVLWLALLWQVLAGTVLQPAWVNQAITASGAYAVIPELVASRVAGALADTPLPLRMRAGDLQPLVDGLLPPSALSGMVTPVIHDVYRWLDSTDSIPAIRVDLRAVRDKIGPAVEAFVSDRWAALPVCSPAELDAFIGSDGRPAQPRSLPHCRPPDDLAASVLPTVDFGELAGQIPPELDLGPVLESADPAIWERLRSLRSAIAFVRHYAWVGWTVLAAWLALLMGLNLDWWYTPLGWAGWPLLAGGGLLALGSLGVRGLYGLVLADRLPTGAAGSLLGDLIRAVLTALSDRIWQTGLTVAAVGLVAVLVLIVAAIARPAPADRGD